MTKPEKDTDIIGLTASESSSLIFYARNNLCKLTRFWPMHGKNFPWKAIKAWVLFHKKKIFCAIKFRVIKFTSWKPHKNKLNVMNIEDSKGCTASNWIYNNEQKNKTTSKFANKTKIFSLCSSWNSWITKNHASQTCSVKWTRIITALYHETYLLMALLIRVRTIYINLFYYR